MKHGYKKAFRFFFFVFSCFSGSRFLFLFFSFSRFCFLSAAFFPFFFPTAFRRPDVFFPASFFPRVSIEAFFLSFFFLSFFFFRFFLNVFFGWWTFFCSLKPLWSPPTQRRTLDGTTTCDFCFAILPHWETDENAFFFTQQKQTFYKHANTKDRNTTFQTQWRKTAEPIYLLRLQARKPVQYQWQHPKKPTRHL